jgi:hypothetical protein
MSERSAQLLDRWGLRDVIRSRKPKDENMMQITRIYYIAQQEDTVKDILSERQYNEKWIRM